MNNISYIVAGSRPWNRSCFDKHLAKLPGVWTFIADRSDLTLDRLEKIAPRYIFFLHWSYIVPEEILAKYECVCFHMADVPYGRGGSPLQNLIVRGHKDTKLTALRMISELDAGPVYFKENLSLSGRAQEIYLRAGELSAVMIRRIAEQEPTPVQQTGEPTVFRRRKPDQSRITKVRDLSGLYDHIRMLDADGYPYAFIEYENIHIEFRKAEVSGDHIVAEATIKVSENQS